MSPFSGRLLRALAAAVVLAAPASARAQDGRPAPCLASLAPGGVRRGSGGPLGERVLEEAYRRQGFSETFRRQPEGARATGSGNGYVRGLVGGDRWIPWCVRFVLDILARSEEPGGPRFFGPRGLRRAEAAVWGLHRRAAELGVFRPAEGCYAPRPGDILLELTHDDSSRGPRGHVEFLVEIDPPVVLDGGGRLQARVRTIGGDIWGASDAESFESKVGESIYTFVEMWDPAAGRWRQSFGGPGRGGAQGFVDLEALAAAGR